MDNARLITIAYYVTYAVKILILKPDKTQNHTLNDIRSTAEERRNRSYIARIQAKMPGFTVHKILTIREQEYI